MPVAALMSFFKTFKLENSVAAKNMTFFHRCFLNSNFPLVSLQLGRRQYCNSNKMSKTALVLLAPGAEEMESVISTDVLRRAGVTVTVAGIENVEPVKCSRNVVIVPDTSLAEAAKQNFDCIILPGGLGGAKILAESKEVGNLLQKQEKSGKLIAAICAAPTALKTHSVGLGKQLTSYPSVKDQLVEKYKYIDDKEVVVDGQLITSKGPGTTFNFALKIAEVLHGEAKSQEVAKGLLLL